MNNAGFEPRERKIKVCHIITKMVYGGASIGTLHLVQKLSSRNFDTAIICGQQSSDEGDLLPNAGKGGFDTIIVRELVREIDPIMDLCAFCALVREFKKRKFDIVHTHGSKAGAIGRLAAAVCGVPIILYTVHGWGLKAGGFLVRMLFRTVERALAHSTTALLFQTKSDRKEASYYKIGEHNQYYLIGNGIDLQHFITYDVKKAGQIRRELKIDDKKVIGTVGRVSAQKNPIGFLEIAREMVAKSDDIVFIFAGGGEMLDKMRNLVMDARLERRILFLGVRNDIPELVANFDVFILPSLWEGMPRSIIEAMVMSKPVVAYEIAGIREIIDDGVNGIIVPVHDSAKMSSVIEYLLNHPVARKKLTANARNTARQYDFNEVVLRIERIYMKLFSEIATRVS